MRSSGSTPAAVPNDQGFVSRNALGECSVRRTRMRKPFVSIEDLLNAMLSMKKKVPDGKTGPEIKSSNLDPFTLPSRKAVTNAPLEAIAVMSQVRVQGRSRWTLRRRGRRVAYPMRSIMVNWNAVSSMVIEMGRVVIWPELIT
jgi:hypothetical protein